MPCTADAVEGIAHPPTKSAGPLLRAGFTEVFVTGISGSFTPGENTTRRDVVNE